MIFVLCLKIIIPTIDQKPENATHLLKEISILNVLQ